MKRMKVMIGLAFVLLVFGIATNASANLIQNGSFELPIIETNWTEREAPDSWTVDSLAGIIINGTPLGMAPEDGNQFYDLGNAATYFLSQTFAVTTAGTYELAWYDSSTSYWIDYDWVTPYSVSFSGTIETFKPGLNNTWTEHQRSFDLTAGSYTLTFTSGASFMGYGTLLDNVTLTSTPPPPVPTPEPATMLLLGIGLVGLAGARRKFKK